MLTCINPQGLISTVGVRGDREHVASIKSTRSPDGETDEIGVSRLNVCKLFSQTADGMEVNMTSVPAGH